MHNYVIRYIASDKKVTPDRNMACSKVMYGNCSRCGKVGASHFGREGPPNSEEQERKQIQHAFFAAKKAKKSFPTAAQLRMNFNAR